MCADYQRQVSYGASIVAANLLYTASTLWDKNGTQLGAADWAAVAANTGYAWGYAGLWLVDGQLGSPDPGCGLQVAHSSITWALQLAGYPQELYTAMDGTPLPALHSAYAELVTAPPPGHLQPAIVRQAADGHSYSEVDPRCYVAGCPEAAPGYEGGAVLSAGGAGARPGQAGGRLLRPPRHHPNHHRRSLLLMAEWGTWDGDLYALCNQLNIKYNWYYTTLKECACVFYLLYFSFIFLFQYLNQ